MIACSSRGGGNQLFGIYSTDGQDIGQRYYNISEGSPYGNTGFLASDGGDIGYKLCKAGTYHVFTMTVGMFVASGVLQYGYYEGNCGALSPNVLNGYKIWYILSRDSHLSFSLASYVMPWGHIRLTLLNNNSVYTFAEEANYYQCKTTDNPFAQYYNQTVQFRLEVW